MNNPVILLPDGVRFDSLRKAMEKLRPVTEESWRLYIRGEYVIIKDKCPTDLSSSWETDTWDEDDWVKVVLGKSHCTENPLEFCAAVVAHGANASSMRGYPYGLSFWFWTAVR